MTTLDYFLKANLYGLLFTSCYWLLLRKHTFFALNRAYLLASVLLSLYLPLVNLPTQTVEELPIPVGVITIPLTTGTVTTEPTKVSLSASNPDWEELGIWVYGIIGMVLLLRLAFRLWSMRQLIQQSPRQVREDYVLIQPTDKNVPTFSFFRFVILNPADAHNDLIIQHELVHVREWHSADVMGLAILQALFWGCPVLWFLDRLLRQVHEFLADQVAVKKSADKPMAYARFLLDYAFGNHPDSLTNSFFNPSLLKQRIQMLHRNATNRWSLGKYALILPLAFGLLAMTTAREELVAVVNQNTDKLIPGAEKVMNSSAKPLVAATAPIVSNKKGSLKVSIPAQQNGKPVAVRYQIPIRFALEKTEDKRTGLAEPATFKPTNSPVGDFPALRASNYPNQPMLRPVAVSIPASSFRPDTSIRPETQGRSINDVHIRGRGPLGLLGSEPLYILDGIVTSDDVVKALIPGKIESVYVLKEAADTNAYGEKGKNGVVIITTKKK